MNEKNTQFLALEEALKDRDYHMDKMRKELEKVQKRLSEVER